MKLNHGVAEFANITPLIAALLAPVSTLYDIPALSQPWYSLNGTTLPDPRASLVLSGVSLSLSVIANSLLVLRFSVHVARLWRFATRISTLAWVIKTCIGVANLITFGALTRNGAGFAYLEGFWCAILSIVVSGIISFLLVFQFFFHFNRSPDSAIRFQGRTFIVSELILFGLIALEALIFSQIEGWSYLQGIYFAVVALLSIGFGDYSPTKTSTKILLFPFAIAGIALLSNQVSLIVRASSAHRKKRRQRFAKLLDTRRHLDLAHSHPQTLDEEARRLYRLVQDEENASELADLCWSAIALIVFWLLGALIYHYMESWSYGDSLYFNYVFFLTIGFGDYSPMTPVGRVVFVLWALLAVPIMTNFVVQAIQSIVTRFSKFLTSMTREKRTERHDLERQYFEPHVSYLDEARSALDGGKSVSSSSNSKEDDPDDENNVGEQAEEEAAVEDAGKNERDLAVEVLSLATYLEAQARTLLIDNLDRDSTERLLLQADANVQTRLLDQLGALDGIPWRERLGELLESESETSGLERVREYRKTYARLLVTGARLLRLEGRELDVFERRRRKE